MIFKFCLVLIVMCELSYVESLKAGDVGVCVVKSSERKSRIKTYNVAINKMCGKRKCVVRRTKKENYIVSRKNNVCCKGWEYNGNSCTPLCSTGCVGGRCTGPEVCQCDPPLTHHPDHKNTCVMPECDPPCVNADCRSGTCQCHENFTPFNSTHCHDCDRGYAATEHLECVPTCEKCQNGSCTAPNVCTCEAGYELVDATCEPVCACANAKCIAPNTCECLEGFVKYGNDCVPCVNGRISGNECVCNEGFTRNGSICQPVCSTECLNGYCSAPNTCSCNDGLVMNETSKRCMTPCPSNCKKCDENGTCISGCVPDE
ncbi:von Willebrand factor D and EGF domain-containing protein-like [Aricia agestis]|uniref:von Willebrand factor D and EGF domain-containing protein-like n=1 Tax=Aricia agestis TaxID=91739 RepID=UPI001C207D65|nr:von Willebrand factor D and EGF domain-containing protein-like [Aricia agestis]